MALLDHDVLTFDCYGTLIDWETGLLHALEPLRAGLELSPDAALEAFARHESAIEKETPNLRYPRVLAKAHRRLASEWGVESTEEAAATFGDSVPAWPAFADSAEALARLKRHFRLVILSNVDRASFRASQERLGITFDAVYTAQDVGSYKPDPRNFEHLIRELEANGIPKEKILHTAQSLFHDHLPARQHGLATCWIDRRHDRQGWGATSPPGDDVAVDYRFASLADMADAVDAEAGLTAVVPQRPGQGDGEAGAA